MGLLNVIKAKEKYNDEDVFRDVITYAINKKYQAGYWGINMMDHSIPAMIQSMKNLQYGFPIKKGSRLIHLVLNFDKDEVCVAEDIVEVFNALKEFFLKNQMQALIVYHERTEANGLRQHIHVILNRRLINGQLYYENNDNYNALANYLSQSVNRSYRVKFNLCEDLFYD